MPQPTLSDVHVNIALTNMSVAFFQEEEGFVADRVFPIIPVSQASDVYYIYTRADFNRNTMKKRAPGSESAGSGFNLSTAPYTADVWSLHKDIPDQIRANADSVLTPDMEATRFLATQALISREIVWVNTYFTTGLWTSGVVGILNSGPPVTDVSVCYWNDYVNSTPILDIRRMKRRVQIASGGFRPNKFVVSRSVYDVLIDHPTIITRLNAGQTWKVGGNSPAMGNQQLLAQIFEVDEVLIADGIQNTAVEGGVESNSFIMGNNALLVYTPPAPGIQVAAAGYTFAWTGLFGSTALGNRLKSFYMPWLESTRTEIDAAYAQKLVSADLGGFFSNVTQ